MGWQDSPVVGSEGAPYRTNFSGTPKQVAEAKGIAAADYAKSGGGWQSSPVVVAPRPAAPRAARQPAAPAAPERSDGFWGNLAGGIIEPVASMATGMIAKPVSEVAGLGAMAREAFPGAPGGDPRAFQQDVQRAMTYEPKTAAGEVVNEYNPLALIGKALGWGAGQVHGAIAPPGSDSGREGVANFVQEALLQAPGIAGAKLAGKPAGPGVRMTPHLQELADRGIQFTPGQMVPALDKIEQGVAQWPIVGAPVRAARGRGVEQFNRSTLQDALTPIGKELPKDLIGEKAIKHTYAELGAAYDDLLTQMKGNLGKPEAEAAKPTGPGPMPPRGAAPDGEYMPAGAREAPPLRPGIEGPEGPKVLPPPPGGALVAEQGPAAAGAEGASATAGAIGGPARAATLWDELETIKGMGAELPPALSAELNRIIDKEVIARFNEGPPGSPQGTGTGATSGESLKAMQTNLRNLYQTKGRSENYDVRQQGLAIKEAAAAVDRMIRRENPDYAAQLKAVDDGYANFKIAQRAASNPGAREGVFTPSQFNRAVRDKDPSKDKRAFTEGTARQKPLANAAQAVLSDTLPDSGTATRLAIMRLLMGNIGGSKAGVFGIPGGLAAATALAPFYSQAGLSAMQRMLLNPPPFGPAVGGAMMTAPSQAQPPER